MCVCVYVCVSLKCDARVVVELVCKAQEYTLPTRQGIVSCRVLGDGIVDPGKGRGVLLYFENDN